MSTTTNAAGAFTLNSTSLSSLGNTVNVVIQAGKWRRQNSVAITPCGTTTVNLTMPANQSQGDLPHIAVVTGAADDIECIFRRIGISDSEFTLPSGTGSINLYEGNGDGGAIVGGTSVATEAQLVESSSALNNYDLVMFGCQGTPNDSIATQNTNSALQNLVGYANNGGRIFATHYGYVWLNHIQPFESSASWLTNEAYSSGSGVIIPATINPNFAQSATLAQWLQNVGASYNGVLGQVGLEQVRVDTSAVNNPPATSWVNLNNSTAKTGTYAGNPSVQFTFDTPVNATTTPTIALSFVNSPVNFQRGDAADTVTVNVSDTSSTTPADSSLNLSLSLPGGVTAVSLSGFGAATGWTCSLSNLSCNRTSPLGAGSTDPVVLTVSVPANAPLGDANLTATVAGGGISGTNQCGRVLYNDYHVESSAAAGTIYPRECSTGALTAQEKFLEYSLYNLSNFVAPVTTDVLDIVTNPTISWPTPSSIYYGTPLGPSQLDATASAPGTFAYTPPAGTVLQLGTNSLNATFTPTDPTSYTPATGMTSINVVPDVTTTMLTSSSSPSAYGSNVTFTATVTGNVVAPVGPVYFYDGTTLIGQANLSTSTGDSAIATFSTSALALGGHSITAAYNNPPFVGGGSPIGANPADFNPSTSAPLAQQVLGTSTTVINGLVSPIDYGQIIGNTGVVTVNGASTGGTTTVYIDGVNVCVLPVGLGVQTCPASTGSGYQVGTHAIYAVFSGDPLYSGSTSPTYYVQILPDPTTITLTSGLNPSYLGNSVTFSATVAAPYAAPTGTVTFYDGNTQLGFSALGIAPQGALQATAAYSTTALAVGTHNITASYAATTDFNASSTATTLAQVVNPPLPLNGQPGFILTVTPTNLNAPVGAGTPLSITIQEVNGYSQPVTLACAGLPIETTCGFTQTVVAAGGGATTLYLTPSAPHACGASSPYFIASGKSTGLIWLSSLLLGVLITRRKRKMFRVITLALALCVLPIIQGCGTGCTDFGLKPGSYSFTVTATPAGTAVSNDPYTGPQSQTINFNATL